MDVQDIRPYLSDPIKAVWDKLPVSTRLALNTAGNEMSALMLRAAKHGPDSLNNEERVYLESAAANMAAIGLNRKNALALVHEVAKAILTHAVNISW